MLKYNFFKSAMEFLLIKEHDFISVFVEKLKQLKYFLESNLLHSFWE